MNHFLSDLRQSLPNAKITTTSPCWIPPCQLTASHQSAEYQFTLQHFTPFGTIVLLSRRVKSSLWSTHL